MPRLTTLDGLLWLLGSAGLGLLALRLYLTGLHRKYPCFFAFLVLRTARTLVLLIPMSRQTYGLVFLITQPLIWMGYVVVVHELYSLALRGYQGIRSLGRWVLYGGLAIGISLSATSLILSWSGPVELYPLLIKAMQLERGVDTSLVILLIVIGTFLALFPIPLSRNLIVYTSVYFAYFLASTVILFARQVGGPGANPFFRTLDLGISAVCALLWVLLINSRGEDTLLRNRAVAPAPASERRLLDTLDAFNTALLRAGASSRRDD